MAPRRREQFPFLEAGIDWLQKSVTTKLRSYQAFTKSLLNRFIWHVSAVYSTPPHGESSGCFPEICCVVPNRLCDLERRLTWSQTRLGSRSRRRSSAEMRSRSIAIGSLNLGCGPAAVSQLVRHLKYSYPSPFEFVSEKLQSGDNSLTRPGQAPR